MGLPTSDHFFYIPAILMLGIAIGYTLGGRAARERHEKLQQRLKE